MPMERPHSDISIDVLAERILAAAQARTGIRPITDDNPDFELAAAYRVAEAVIRRRIARGERPVGWKIGFTNRTIWDEYGVHAPIWGPMYDTTVAEVTTASGPVACPIGPLVEPRIEPEIVLRLARAPEPGMDEADLLGCIDAVSHGVEVVQSLFPAWRFRAPDTVAAFALHGLLRHGPFVPIDGRLSASGWRSALESFSITLARNGRVIDRGQAHNVLGGPLSALRHVVRGLADGATGWQVRSGDIVTTGTVTRAFPVQPGERWTTQVRGLDVPALDIRFDA